MSIASWTKKAGFLLAVLLIGLALPGWSDEKDPQPSASTTESAQSETQKGTPSGETATNTAQPSTSPTSMVAPIQTPPESSTPPRNLHKVGDHWTPYEPPDPESFPEGAQVYRIVSGDNLWNLANTQFQNPYLWPQIWNENRYILDSHWIYPGDPLLLPPRPTVVSEIIPAAGTTAPPPTVVSEIIPDAGQTAPPLAPAPAGAPTEESEADSMGSEEEFPEEIAEASVSAEDSLPPETGGIEYESNASADHSDIYCTGEVRHDYKKTPLYIANEEQGGKTGLAPGDLLYLNGGRQGNKVQPGAVFQIIAKEEEVFHPVTDKWLGTYIRRVGMVKVLAVQESTAIAQVTEGCGARIEVGFELEPYREIPVPDMKEVPFSNLDVEPSGKANGYIVHVQDGRNQASTGNIVDIDLGSEDGLKPGDVLQAYQTSAPPPERRVKYDYKWGNRRYESQNLRSEDRDLIFPRKPIGTLMVLTTEGKTSTAKIIYAVREMEVGELVELR